MRLRSIVINLVCAGSLAACSSPSSNSSVASNGSVPSNSGGATNNDCDAAPECYSDEVLVETCEGEEDCFTYEGCGTEIYCVQIGHCDEPPTCDEDQVEVTSCDGLDECIEVTREPCAPIYCAPAQIVASDYDQTCASAVDCLLIHQGDPCACQVCFDGAISSSAYPDYESDVDAMMCEPEMACPDVECGEPTAAFCRDGTCNAEPAPVVSASDFDQTCTEDSDCTSVYEGSVCAACQCPDAAINVGALDDYLAEFDPDCAVPSPCDCGAVEVVCNAGACEVVP